MTVIPGIAELLSSIEDGTIPLVGIFAGVDYDLLLDKRNSDPSFDRIYRQAWKRNEKLRFVLNVGPTEAVRKQSFLAVSNSTEQHEIASYVSDDFDLIAWQSYSCDQTELENQSDPFVEWLYAQYLAGEFPLPPWPEGMS